MKAGCKAKDLIGIPWLLAFALRSDGWYLRSDIIWLKENLCRRAAATDRAAAMSISFTDETQRNITMTLPPLQSRSRRERLRATGKGAALDTNTPRKYQGQGKVQGINKPRSGSYYDDALMPTTRNKRDVWLINTVPYKGGHFAALSPGSSRKRAYLRAVRQAALS